MDDTFASVICALLSDLVIISVSDSHRINNTNLLLR